MFLSYLTLFVALSLSIVAAWYSILGLTAIFASAVIPIIIMGGFLEVAKVTVTVWLHEYWHRCRLAMKLYLVPAVGMLMLVTSMGIFGFLSKAHSDQSLVSGDSVAKVAIYDEKIKTEKDNIDANRKVLKQFDEAVDQVMGRSTDEKGADKAVQIRRSQQKERSRILAEITESQKRIATLNEERAPLAAEFRKIEAEVGPIKYIAALVYGDNPDANVLEKAVRLVIILLVVVFDPLAIMMVLAATESIKWEKEPRLLDETSEPSEEEKEKAVTEFFDNGKLVARGLDADQAQREAEEANALIAEIEPEVPEVMLPEEPKDEKPFVPNIDDLMHAYDDQRLVSNHDKRILALGIDVVDRPGDYVTAQHDEDEDSPEVKAAKSLWKEQNPDDTLKHQRTLLATGKIDELPWMKLIADNELPRQVRSGFGIKFPEDPIKGDTFVRVDQMPSVLFKYNGSNWIVIDKTLSDNYTYDTAYIEHLIEKLTTGELDPDDLSNSEQIQVEQLLQTRTN